MSRRFRTASLLTLALLGTILIPPISAGAGAATSVVKVAATVTSSITTSMPLVRLTFSHSVKLSNLPALVTRPALASTWVQIGRREVEAVISGPAVPLTNYTVELPSSMNCASSCAFTSVRVRSASTTPDYAFEQQLLATLNYLPATFTAISSPSSPTSPTSGFYTWAYPHLPSALSTLWGVGNNNVIVRGALMAFQNDNQLPTTGVVNTATWNDLLSAAANNKTNPSSYNYVTVSESSPELVRLYVGGKYTFDTLANTGISVDPTPLGTFPVYLRYVSQTMSGTNPDGSHYSDPGIPWISYFVGGSALHGFIRSTYGWPQSLGCVEMPFTSAHTIWPHTPIGTLVTVQSI
jgi:peptidoglycan hydrolase-like protein with peptidoglycan-binding domain